MEQKEARAILGYITYLENVARTYSSGAVRAPQSPKKDYNQPDLDLGLMKLVGIAARSSSQNQKKE